MKTRRETQRMEEEDERTNSNADDHLLSEVRGDFLGLRWTPLPATPARRRRSEGRVVQHRPQKSARTSGSVINYPSATLPRSWSP